MQLVVSPITRPEPPLASHPPPPCLCDVTLLPREISRSSALLSPCTQSGEAWKAAGARQMENKERKQRHCSEEARRQGASSLSLPGQPVPPAPGLGHPQAAGNLPHPCRDLTSDLTKYHLSLGDPWQVIFPSHPFLICKMRELDSKLFDLRQTLFPYLCQGSFLGPAQPISRTPPKPQKVKSGAHFCP